MKNFLSLNLVARKLWGIQMTNQEKRLAFDSKVKSYLDMGMKDYEIAMKLDVAISKVRNARYRIIADIPTQTKIRASLTIDTLFDAKFVSDSAVNGKCEEYTDARGKKWIDVSAQYGL